MRKKAIAIAAIAVAAIALAFFSSGSIEENLVYYWSPTELLQRGKSAYNATVRLGGVVEKGSMDWNEDTLDLKFRLSMAPEKGTDAINVLSKGAPPQMFREGIGAVVEGYYDGGLFRADRVMVKHSNEYQAPEGHAENAPL